MEITNEKAAHIHQKLRSIRISDTVHNILLRSLQINQQVVSFGLTRKMDDYEKRKLTIFNQLNFFQLLTGVLVPLLGLLHQDSIPTAAWLVACLPALTSMIVLGLNYFRAYDAALFTYFLLYPFFTCI